MRPGLGYQAQMAAPLTFRPATPADRTELIALQWRSALGNPRDREALLANTDAIDIPPEHLTAGRTVIAVLNGANAGFAVVLPRADGDAELDGLFVDPASWKLGIGRALCSQAIGLAGAMGAGWLHVVANPEAVDFYRNAGFELAGETETRFGSAPLLRLRLQDRRRPCEDG